MILDHIYPTPREKELLSQYNGALEIIAKQTAKISELEDELSKNRTMGDHLAAALLNDYSRNEALAQWAADLKLPENELLVERLKEEGVPVEKYLSNAT